MLITEENEQLIYETKVNSYVRGSLRLLCVIFDLSLFIFCFIKIKIKYNISNKTIKYFKLFSVMDIQLSFISFYDFIGSCFYLALFSDKYSKPADITKKPDGYPLAWAVIQVWSEIGSVFSYIQLALYSIIIMIKSNRLKNLWTSSIKTNRSTCCKIGDLGIKKLFICIQVIFPILVAVIPVFINGYEYSTISSWPFLTNKYSLSITCYYLYVVIAEIVTIIQLIVTIYSLVSISKLYKAFLKQEKIKAEAAAASSDIGDEANIFALDEDIDATSRDSTMEAVMTYKKMKKQQKLLMSAILKSLGFSLCYIIEWTTSLVARLVNLIAENKNTNKNYVIPQSIKLAFAIGGPSLSFLNAIFYYMRLGIVSRKNCCKKKHSSLALEKYENPIVTMNPTFGSNVSTFTDGNIG